MGNDTSNNINGVGNRALVLAAGGARGAYQAGSMLALAEENITFSCIAGTSVGTLNGAFYVQGGGTVAEMQELCSLWRDIAAVGIVKLNPKLFSYLIPKKWSKDKSILDPKPLRNILDKHLDYEKIQKSTKKLIITTIPSVDPIWDIVVGSKTTPVYFSASEVSAKILRDALLAATAIPFAFPSIDIDGTNYTDAGLSTPVPSKVLFDLGCRSIISIMLQDTHIQNRLDYPGGLLFQIRPSRNIAEEFSSMLDFSIDTIEYLIELGHADTKKYIREASLLSDPLIRIEENKRNLDGLLDQLPL